jgi:stage V sporulation protein S
MEVLKVSAKSSPNAVAGAIAGILREDGNVCVQVIGAGALNQAVKAIAIAGSFVAEDGLDPICIPSFHDIDINGESRTAIRLTVEDRRGRLMSLESSPEPAGALESDG